MFKTIHIAYGLTYLIFLNTTLAQNNSISMQMELNEEIQSLIIQQQIRYHNISQDTLHTLYLHDWNNAFSNKNTALGKRFVENYSKKFFFAREKDRGATHIKNISLNFQNAEWERSGADIIKLPLKKRLLPNNSVLINLSYIVKIPNAKFTNYGKKGDSYNLRYFIIVPAVYDQGWQWMHHLDMDDQYQSPTDYTIFLKAPKNYQIAGNLHILKEGADHYKLTGKNRMNVELYIAPHLDFEQYKVDKLWVSTNLNNVKIDSLEKTAILRRQLTFLQEHLGKYPHSKILISKTSYEKNPVYGINQLPGFLRPFSDIFAWDIRMFKTLSQYYVNNSLFLHTRKKTWLHNAFPQYMIMRYVEQYYPKMKLLGNLSKIWGIRSYHLSELEFNDNYGLMYQYTASRNKDQPLNVQSDSLTNFNRLILNKYKAGMGLQYLEDYLGDSIVPKSIKRYFSENILKTGPKKNFRDYIDPVTDKEINWFFDTFLNTEKKIDYTIKNVQTNADSIKVTVRNKRDIAMPVSLYSLYNDTIQSKKWLSGFEGTKTLWLPKGKSKRWVLNYEKKIPEIDLKNNWENNEWSLLKRPLKIRLFRDMEDPSYNQLFLTPRFNYNLYDGFLLGCNFSNKTFLKKVFEYSLTPFYGFKSHSLTSSFKASYWKFLDNPTISSYRLGISGAYYHYHHDLTYIRLVPYIRILFKRKNLRSVKSNSIGLSYLMINRETNPLENNEPEKDRYNVLNLNYSYQNPEIINNFSFFSNLELGSNFSKFFTDIRFQKLTNSNRQFGARLFAGFFLYNNTSSDFFSFGVNRPNDYLFRYKYYGRSETSGFFNQQFILNDGGFKSVMDVPYANQWITSLNTSVGLWRWLEIYNDVGLVKNRDRPVYFVHDKGIRLNFINNIFEVYFPLHSNRGWEIMQPHYEERIRFVLTINITRWYNFLLRGFM